MYETIINKLNNDIECELFIDELKYIYEDNIKEFESIRNLRNNYNDLCKLFGKKHVACTLEEINQDTICYIGDLLLEYEMNAHNIRYVYGDIISWYDKIKNLENLEIVYGSAEFDYLKTYEGLDNLRIIGKKFSLNEVLKGDFSSLEYVNMFLLVGLKCAKDIIMPEYVRILWLPLLKTNEGLVLPKNLEQLYLLDGKLIDNLILPDSLEVLRVGNEDIDLDKVKKKVIIC